MNKLSTLSLAALASLFVMACTTTEEPPVDDTPPAEQDTSIIGVAEDAGSFATLLAAVEAAGLTSTLQDGG
ncbi:MAG: fasciclin domain-containing protein, partial [Deltaproteobacteria bacterium]|nr:fasciclin domain-containing protein [Deltaproteobacteria bacterium]